GPCCPQRMPRIAGQCGTVVPPAMGCRHRRYPGRVQGERAHRVRGNTRQQQKANDMTQKTRWPQFGVLITVFFFWGFVAASNGILIPVFKKAFDLTQAQSMYVAIAFYVAYTVGSLIYAGVSKAMGVDVL